MRADGSVRTGAGYDPVSGWCLVGDLTGEDMAVPVAPTAAEVATAVGLLDEAFGEFPFRDGSSRANFLGLLLTPLLRPAIDGPTPLALISKPQQGVGATLLAECVGIVAERRPQIIAYRSSNAELEKRLLPLLQRGRRTIVFDNVEDSIQGSCLALVLTSDEPSFRPLGTSTVVDVPNLATWIATGINLSVRGDLRGAVTPSTLMPAWQPLAGPGVHDS